MLSTTAILAAALTQQAAPPAAVPDAHEATPIPAPPPAAEPAPLKWEWFPATPPTLAPYLANINQMSASCLNAGGVIQNDPISQAAQAVKTELAKYGITYQLYQSAALSVMSNVQHGNNALGTYSATLYASATIFNSTEADTAGWVNLEVDAGSGFGFDIAYESPQRNMGTATWPNYTWVTSSVFIAELSWAQSFFNGTLILMGGQMDFASYLDTNQYANNEYTQMLNWAFSNNQVIPMTQNGLGFLAQWQPVDWGYAMFATCANNTANGQAPWSDIGLDNWSYILELGYISKDTFGLGPGTYRVDPFVATANGHVSGGVGLNFQQQLGASSNLGLFGRFGITSEAIGAFNGAATQASLGVAITGAEPSPLGHRAFDYLGVGFEWTEPAGGTPLHENELGLEISYVYRLTPTATLQPDFQVIWDPAYSKADTSVLFTLSIVTTW